MAVATRPKRPTPSIKRPVAESHRRRPEPEAPDRGQGAVEAPEGRACRLAEAPDAGEGRAALLEHEFTHGRSQS